MPTVIIMQGSSHPIFMRIRQNGIVLTPSMVEDVEIFLGENLRKTYAAGEVGFDYKLFLWYVVPTQQETMDLELGHCPVKARVKYKNSNQERSDVIGADGKRLVITDTFSKEEL